MLTDIGKKGLDSPNNGAIIGTRAAKVRIRMYNDAQHRDTIVQLGALMHADSQYAHMPYNKSKVHALCSGVDGKTLAIYVAEHDDAGVIGAACYNASPYFFTPGICVSDLAVYVLPAYRHTLAFAGLVRAGERWAKQIGATSIVMGVTAPSDPELIAKAYSKLGYERLGIVMRKEL